MLQTGTASSCRILSVHTNEKCFQGKKAHGGGGEEKINHQI